MTDDIMGKNPITKAVLNRIEESAHHIGRIEAEIADTDMWSLFNDTPITSPIEQLFYCGLCAVARVNGFSLSPVVGVPFPLPKPAPHPTHQMVWCYPQSAVGRYRADFILYLSEGPNATPTVVELDGHQWHDRDEKQRRYEKRRDRFMQSAGYRVARFTGAEVTKDPYRAAADALDLVVATAGNFLTPGEYWG